MKAAIPAFLRMDQEDNRSTRFVCNLLTGHRLVLLHREFWLVIQSPIEVMSVLDFSIFLKEVYKFFSKL